MLTLRTIHLSQKPTHVNLPDLPFRSAVRSMGGYVPGEQPQTEGWIKLNTNENPYPPSPKVVEAIQNAASGRLNVYPDPAARAFREAAAELFNVEPNWILPANGSDENLTIIVRSFCDADETIVYPYPSYVLYESLAQIQGCRIVRLPLNADWQWDSAEAARTCGPARISFVPNPNSPTGNRWTAEQLVDLLPENGVLVLDEAYGDFADEPHRGELLKDSRFDDRIICTRTLSKSYSLAGIRFGFSIASPELTGGMQKVKDSYNCDAIAIAAATAAIKDQDWMQENRRSILATRARLSKELDRLGFRVHPSEANFVWTTHESGRHKAIYEGLKQRQVLVRYMTFAEIDPPVEGLRITIGTDGEVDRLLEALAEIVRDV
ncbi:MAG: histidinol-phosphate transaminase [Fuerstiella sp.]